MDRHLIASLMLGTAALLGTAAAKLNALARNSGPDAVVAKRALERLFVEYGREEGA